MKRGAWMQAAARLWVTVAALAGATVAPAQTILDFNVASGDWTNASHWTPAQVPTTMDDAYIFGNRTATLGAGATGAVANVNLGYARGNGNGYGNLVILGDLNVATNMRVASQGGNVPWVTCMATQAPGTTVTVSNILYIGAGTHVSGVYHLDTDATLRAGQVRIADSYDGNGTLNIRGWLIVTGDAGIWNGQGNGPTRPGTINQYANTAATIGGTLYIGGGGTYSSGTYTLGTNAVVTVGGNLSIGNGWGCVGTFTIGTGATVTVAGATTMGTGQANSAGTIHMNGDTLDFGGTLLIGNAQLNHNRGALHLPRQTTTSGTFANTGGSLHFGIGGDPASGAFDRVTVSGGTTALGGELLVELEGGYKPEATNSYTIVTRTGGTLWGTFANAAVSGSSYRLGGIEAVVTYDADNVVLSDIREASPGCMIIVR